MVRIGREIEVALDVPGGRVLDQQVEPAVGRLARPRGRILDPDAEGLAPVTFARGNEGEADRQGQGGRRATVLDTTDDRVTSAVQEVLRDRLAHRALGP